MAGRRTFKPDGAYQWQSQYPTHTSTVALLHDVLVALQVTKWRLVNLIGADNHAYGWWRGERRPSPLYLSRLLHLLLLRLRGELDIKEFKPTSYWARWANPPQSATPPARSR